MSTIKTNLVGLDGLRARIGALPDAARRGTAAGMRDLAEETAANLREDLSTRSSPSDPDAPPSDPSGQIADAITIETGPDGSVNLVVDLPFAADLEFGTSRMAARPFLRPAATGVAQNGVGLLIGHVANTMKEQSR